MADIEVTFLDCPKVGERVRVIHNGKQGFSFPIVAVSRLSAGGWFRVTTSAGTTLVGTLKRRGVLAFLLEKFLGSNPEYLSSSTAVAGELSQADKENPRIDPSPQKRDKPGEYMGRHYTTYVADVRELKEAQRWEDAEQLLLKLCKAIERHCTQKPKMLYRPPRISQSDRDTLPAAYLEYISKPTYDAPHVAPPWYYLELAKIYRKRKDYDAELKILQHYLTLPCCKEEKIMDRIDKTRALKAKEEARKDMQ